MSIVVHHFLPGDYRQGVWENLTHNFNDGVNYFYILSGFVMVLAYQKAIFNTTAPFPKAAYWVKRVARIYPVYLAALLATLGFHFFVSPSFSNVGLRLPFEVAMLQTWFGLGSLNSPAWSVSCEVFFYFLFPFFALKIGKLAGHQLHRSAAFFYGLILVLTVFGALAHQYLRENPSGPAGFLYGIIVYHPVLRVFTFIVGTLLGSWFLKNGPTMERFRPYSLPVLLATTVAILAIFTLVPAAHGEFFNYGIMVPLYALLIVSICNVGGAVQKALSHKACIFLGDISYGLYILQVPVQMFFAHYIMPTKLIGGFLLYTVLLLLVSAASYWLLEKPLRQWITAFLMRNLDSQRRFSMPS